MYVWLVSKSSAGEIFGVGRESVGNVGQDGGFEKVEVNNARLLHADDNRMRSGRNRQNGAGVW